MKKSAQELNIKLNQKSDKKNHGFLISPSQKKRSGQFVVLAKDSNAASCSGHCKAGSCIAL